MREPKLLRTCELDPDEIVIEGRLRPVSDAAVASIISSFEELGLIKDEVIVRQVKHKGGQLRLIAGGHRVEACRQMGRMVPAKVFDCTDDWARLMEVDDNLAGGELTVLDTAIFLAERKAVYERLHPEAKNGAKGLIAMNGIQTDKMSVWSFAAATAEKLGASERHVRRLISAGTALSKTDIDWLRQAPKSIALADLQIISKIGDDDERENVCRKLGRGTAKSAANARHDYAAERGRSKPPSTDFETDFKRLSEAWKRAPLEARVRFLKSDGLAVFNLLREIRGDDT